MADLKLLAKKSLEEIPYQIIDYMEMQRINPNDPAMNIDMELKMVPKWSFIGSELTKIA